MGHHLLKSKIQLYGFQGFLRQGIKACIRKFTGFSWNYYYLMQLSLKENINWQEREGWQMRKLCWDDFSRGDRTYFTQAKLDVYRIWFEKGFEAYGVFFGKELVCSAWISYHELVLTEKSVYVLPANSALLLDDYCHINYRRKGLHRYINLYRLAILREKKIDQAYVVIRKNNKPALKTQLACGLRILKSFAVYRLGKKEIITLALEGF